MSRATLDPEARTLTPPRLSLRPLSAASSDSGISWLISARSPGGSDRSWTASASIALKKLTERFDSDLDILQVRMVLGQLGRWSRTCRLDPARVACVREGSCGKGPDVGLGPEEFAASPARWTLWTTPQDISSRRFMLTLPRETPSHCEVLGRPVTSGDIQQREQLPHRGIDAPGASHQPPCSTNCLMSGSAWGNEAGVSRRGADYRFLHRGSDVLDGSSYGAIRSETRDGLERALRSIIGDGEFRPAPQGGTPAPVSQTWMRREIAGVWQEHVQKVARAIPTNRIISKKMMKIDGEFRVQFQCMPRFAGAECRRVGLGTRQACFRAGPSRELRRCFHA